MTCWICCPAVLAVVSLWMAGTTLQPVLGGGQTITDDVCGPGVHLIASYSSSLVCVPDVLSAIGLYVGSGREAYPLITLLALRATARVFIAPDETPFCA